MVSSGAAFASESKGADVPSPAWEWLIGIVDDTREVGYNVSVAVDPVTGHSYISYYEGIDGDLWLARTGASVGNCGPGNTWECRVLDSAGIVGKFSSIAVGGPGPMAKLYISYHDVTNGALKVVEGSVERTTGALSYVPYVVESGDPGSGIFVGTKTSITIDDSGTPHIGYEGNSSVAVAIKHATQVAPGVGDCVPANDWECSHVTSATDIGGFIDIDLSPGGVPSIAFFNFYSAETSPMIATQVASGGNCNSPDEWQCELIPHQGFSTGEYLSFEITDTGVPQLAYRNATAESLEWARYVGSGGNCGAGGDSWQCEEIDDVGPGGSPSGIAIQHDGDGHPIIAYQAVHAGFQDLKIARPLDALSWPATGNCGPLSPTFFSTWLCENLEMGTGVDAEAVGGLSMAMTAHGEAVTAYRELHDPGSGPLEGRIKAAMEPRLLFRDGFESGNLSAWSQSGAE